MTVRKWEVGMRKWEVGRRKLEFGSGSSEVGVRKFESFDCGFRIADFGLNS